MAAVRTSITGPSPPTIRARHEVRRALLLQELAGPSRRCLRPVPLCGHAKVVLGNQREQACRRHAQRHPDEHLPHTSRQSPGERARLRVIEVPRLSPKSLKCSCRWQLNNNPLRHMCSPAHLHNCRFPSPRPRAIAVAVVNVDQPATGQPHKLGRPRCCPPGSQQVKNHSQRPSFPAQDPPTPAREHRGRPRPRLVSVWGAVTSCNTFDHL